MQRAKDFSLNRIEITSSTGEKWDVKNIVGELNIFEDMFANTVTGNLAIEDANNFLAKIPITGSETLTLDYNTPGNKPTKKTYRIYKVSERYFNKERTQAYLVHFSSQALLTSMNTRVEKSYKGKLISDIASDIMRNYLGSSFAHVEGTKHLHHVVIPGWNPFRTLNWLRDRANSATYNGANYVCFENQDGFSFRSVESMVDPHVDSVIDYTYDAKPIRVQSGSTTDRDDRDQYSIESFEFLDLPDTLKAIASGMYGGQLITHDLIRKKVETTEFNYAESWLNHVHIEPHRRYNPITRSYGFSYLAPQGAPDVNTQSNLSMYPVSDKKYPNKVDSWLLARMSQMEQIESIRMRITIPGDNRRKVGEVVQVHLPSPEPPDNAMLKYDPYYRGRFLITAARHIIGNESYTTILELTKDAVFASLP